MHIEKFCKEAEQFYADNIYITTKGTKQQYVLIDENVSGNGMGRLDAMQMFIMYTFNSEVTFNDIFFDEKDTIINQIKQLQEKKINKLAILLYGPPGTGKTSIIKAICNMTNRSIQYLKLNEIKTFHELLHKVHQNKVLNMSSQRNMDIPLGEKVIILEDIDRDNVEIVAVENDNVSETNKIKTLDDFASMVNKNEKNKQGITQTDLLQLFDGVLELHDSIIIITTNNIEKLSPALIRPGRIDLKLFIGNINYRNAILLCQKLYNIQILNKNELAIIKTLVDKGVTPATVKQLCLQFKSINDWVTTD